MFFDLQSSPDRIAQWRKDRGPIMDEYPLSDEMREAVLADDIAAIAPNVNAYLLRFYVAICGIKDPEFIATLQAMKPAEGREVHHG